MITADHLAEAKAYVDELTSGADFIPHTPEWLEFVTSSLAPIDCDALEALAMEHPAPGGRPGIFQAFLSGAVVGLFAQHFAERDSDSPDAPSQRLATLPGPDSTTGVGWPE